MCTPRASLSSSKPVINFSGMALSEGNSWSVEEKADLLETISHSETLIEAYAAHAEKWDRSPDAPRYAWERMNYDSYANSRDA